MVDIWLTLPTTETTVFCEPDDFCENTPGYPASEYAIVLLPSGPPLSEFEACATISAWSDLN